MAKKSKNFIVKLAGFCILMAIILIGAGELAIRSDAEHEKALVQDTLQNSGALIAQDIQRNIASGIFVTDTLDTLLKTSAYKVDDFNTWGRQITAIHAGASVVQLAPDGVVTHIYPLEGNEGALGHDLLTDSRRDAGALKTIDSRELTFVGPVKLIQNGKYAVIARKPVFRGIEGGESFWGFTIALILVEDILPDQITLLEAQGNGIRLEGDDPDAQTNLPFYESQGWKDTDFITVPIEVPNGRWTLKLRHPPIVNEYYAVFRLIIILGAVLASLSVFVQQSQMRSRQVEIETLNGKLTQMTYEDELTGAGNRRAGMRVLENQLNQADRYGRSLSIAMVDLDRFKQVNDRYGHPAGDRLLRHLAASLKSAVRGSDMVFRLGGDEFMMVFPQTDMDQCRKAIDNVLQYMKIHSCRLKAAVLPVSLSIGLAESRPDESVDALLHRADIKLYEAKEAGRGCVKY
ncbi:MAG: sensor domain-containing diguanylate cyclase [Desulfobacter sp.]|nr:MAG: sensor domain-containing diguanylate cyclase [Desulfobacter sp.]